MDLFMVVSRNFFGSRKLILFAYAYIAICEIFHPKTCISEIVPTWQRFYVCIEDTRVKRFNHDMTKRRQSSKQRSSINALKLINGLRLIIYVMYSVFVIKLSGDVEITQGAKRTTKWKVISSLYVCMVIIKLKHNFVEAPRKFIIPKLSTRKPRSSSVQIVMPYYLYIIINNNALFFALMKIRAYGSKAL